MKAQAPAQARQRHESAATRPASAREHSGQSAFADNRPEAIAQRKVADAIRNMPYVVAQRQRLSSMFGNAAQFEHEPASTGNTSGLPDGPKSGVESVSGISLDDPGDHYNSAGHAQLNALAHAQGRLKPTIQMAGMSVNHNAELESEADAMGATAASSPAQPIQMKVVSGRLNVIGEQHDDYKAGRDKEKKFLAERYGISPANYWQEQEFKGVEKTAENRPKGADPIIGHLRPQLIALIAELRNEYGAASLLNQGISEKVLKGVERYWKSVFDGFLIYFGPDLIDAGYKYQDDNLAVDDVDKARLKKAWPLFKKADEAVTELRESKNDEADKWFDWTRERNQKAQRESALKVRTLLHKVDQIMGNVVYAIDETVAQDKAVDLSREQSMVASADRAVAAGITGAWKVGNSHVASMQNEAGPHRGTKGATFTLTTRDEFRTDIADHEKAKAGALTIIPGEGVRDIPVEGPARQTGAVEERNSKEYDARVQHEKDMAGGLTLIPGEGVRDVPLPPEQPRTGVVREINLPSTL